MDNRENFHFSGDSFIAHAISVGGLQHNAGSKRGKQGIHHCTRFAWVHEGVHALLSQDWKCISHL